MASKRTLRNYRRAAKYYQCKKEEEVQTKKAQNRHIERGPKEFGREKPTGREVAEYYDELALTKPPEPPVDKIVLPSNYQPPKENTMLLSLKELINEQAKLNEEHRQIIGDLKTIKELWEERLLSGSPPPPAYKKSPEEIAAARAKVAEGRKQAFITRVKEHLKHSPNDAKDLEVLATKLKSSVATLYKYHKEGHF